MFSVSVKSIFVWPMLWLLGTLFLWTMKPNSGTYLLTKLLFILNFCSADGFTALLVLLLKKLVTFTTGESEISNCLRAACLEPLRWTASELTVSKTGRCRQTKHANLHRALKHGFKYSTGYDTSQSGNSEVVAFASDNRSQSWSEPYTPIWYDDRRNIYTNN